MNHITPTQFWTPSTAREEVRLPSEYMQMLAVFAKTCAQIHLGLHCAQCGQDLGGKNADQDHRWMMECGCRTFFGANPLPRDAA